MGIIFMTLNHCNIEELSYKCVVLHIADLINMSMWMNN